MLMVGIVFIFVILGSVILSAILICEHFKTKRQESAQEHQKNLVQFLDGNARDLLKEQIEKSILKGNENILRESFCIKDNDSKGLNRLMSLLKLLLMKLK